MKTKRNIVAVVILASICICLFWAAQTSAVEKSVEVNTYSLPETRTDAARAIDAYQQMINRLMDQNDRKTAEINIRLANIEASLKRIEKKIGAEPACNTASKDKKCCGKCDNKCSQPCDKKSESINSSKCSTKTSQTSCSSETK